MFRRLLFLTVILSSPLADARDRDFIEETPYANPEVEDPEPWKERESDLPSYPQAEDLLDYSVDLPNSPFTYSVDSNSISIGEEDGVIRYTLVIRSKRGAWNVSHEGMRCNTRDHKVYAYGSKRIGFKALKKPQWRRLRQNKLDQHLLDLREFYFCQLDLHKPFSVERILYRLKHPPVTDQDLSFY